MTCEKELKIGDGVIFLDGVGQYGELRKGIIHKETKASWVILFDVDDEDKNYTKSIAKNRRTRIYKLN